MAIQILGRSSELTLIFDRFTGGPSGERLEFLGQTLSEVEGVKSVQTRSLWFGRPRMTIVFDSENDSRDILRKMAIALRASNGQAFAVQRVISAEVVPSTEADSVEMKSVAPMNNSPTKVFESEIVLESERVTTDEELPEGCPLVRHRLRELSYGILSLGSFAMSWVGLVVPGIPTVPFVLLTAHFALQASPRLRRWLLSSRVFGPTMRDWQEHRAIRRSVKIQAYIFTCLIIVVGLFFAPPILALYLVMGIASALGLFAVSRIPTIEPTENREPLFSMESSPIPSGVA